MLAGYLLVLIAACMWGILGPVSKYIFSQGITPLETAFWRAALSWCFFGSHALILGRVTVQRRHFPAMILFGVMGITVFFASYQLAIEDTGAATASVLLYTAPAWVALMAWGFLKERMTGPKITAVAMTVAGVVGVSLGPDITGGGEGRIEFGLLGVFFGLTAGFTYALYYIFGKLFLDRYATPTIFLYVLPVGALCLIPFVDFAHKTPQAWLGLLVLAGVSTYGAYSVYYAGLRRLEATRAAVVATLEPVVAAITAFFWWDERFGLLGYLGSGLILAAVLLTVYDKSVRTIPDQTPVAGGRHVGHGN